jgi:hypothetical protein
MWRQRGKDSDWLLIAFWTDTKRPTTYNWLSKCLKPAEWPGATRRWKYASFVLICIYFQRTLEIPVTSKVQIFIKTFLSRRKAAAVGNPTRPADYGWQRELVEIDFGHVKSKGIFSISFKQYEYYTKYEGKQFCTGFFFFHMWLNSQTLENVFVYISKIVNATQFMLPDSKSVTRNL